MNSIYIYTIIFPKLILKYKYLSQNSKVGGMKNENIPKKFLLFFMIA